MWPWLPFYVAHQSAVLYCPKLLYYVTVLFVSLASTKTKMEQTEKPK